VDRQIAGNSRCGNLNRAAAPESEHSADCPCQMRHTKVRCYIQRSGANKNYDLRNTDELPTGALARWTRLSPVPVRPGDSSIRLSGSGPRTIPTSFQRLNLRRDATATVTWSHRAVGPCN